MSDKKVVLVAKVYLLKTEEGGRFGYIANGYHPNCVFDDVENILSLFNSDGQIFFDTTITDKIFPGDLFSCEIHLRNNPFANPILQPGLAFIIREGSRKVGEGKIISIK